MIKLESRAASLPIENNRRSSKIRQGQSLAKLMAVCELVINSLRNNKTHLIG